MLFRVYDWSMEGEVGLESDDRNIGKDNCGKYWLNYVYYLYIEESKSFLRRMI